jgi:hypothetical protein
LEKALEGQAIHAKAKGRITRAVNHVLKSKKKPEITAAELF